MGRGGGLTRLTDEQALADFWAAYADGSTRRLAFVARHPAQVLLAVVAALRLVQLTCHLGAPGPGRLAVAAVIAMPGLLLAPARWTGLAALVVPADPAAYSEGARRQTLRRRCRAAERRGVRVRAVAAGPERAALLARARAAEQAHPDPLYRRAAPDNTDLLDHDLWLVAEDAEGDPLLLSVTPWSGDTAVLRYFRTLGWGPAHSDARYLATRHLVEELSRRGVRVLLDTAHPGEQKNGVRHFQRMVGFRYHRVRRGRHGRHGRRSRPGRR